MKREREKKGEDEDEDEDEHVRGGVGEEGGKRE